MIKCTKKFKLQKIYINCGISLEAQKTFDFQFSICKSVALKIRKSCDYKFFQLKSPSKQTAMNNVVSPWGRSKVIATSLWE